MLTIRAMSDGNGYCSRYLEHSDYYAEGERVTGMWQGRGADLLGLSGPVKTEEFEALRQGLDPGTNEFLRVRRSADRAAVDGTKLAPVMMWLSAAVGSIRSWPRFPPVGLFRYARAFVPSVSPPKRRGSSMKS